MLINRDFNGVSFPYTAPLRKAVQIDNMPMEYRKLLLDAWNVGQNEKALNVDTVKWALNRTDIISLSNSHDENASWMRMLAATALNAEVDGKHPYRTSGVTTWATEKNDGEILAALKSELEKRCNKSELPSITAAVNFPYGDMPAENAVKAIARAATWLEGYKGEKVIETVLDYQSWISGNHDKARESLRQQIEAAHAAEVKVKVDVVALAHIHAKGSNFYDSLYGATFAALAVGADIIKTSTDKALKEPLSSAVAQDVTTPEVMLPVLAALRDYNKTNKIVKGLEISGGQTSPLDAVRARYMVEKVAGARTLSKTTLGGSYMFARSLMQYIAENNPQSGLSREHFGPQGRKAELPNTLKGI